MKPHVPSYKYRLLGFKETIFSENLLEPCYRNATLVIICADIFGLYNSIIMRVPDKVVLFEESFLTSLCRPLNLCITKCLVITVLVVGKVRIQGLQIT